MTENKRFELTHFDCDYITDHLTGEDYPTIDKDSMFELVKQINELVDENEELKQAYTQLKHRHSLLYDVCIDAECDRDSYRKDIVSLEKENEGLKQTIEKLCKAWG